jgi:hypothetical protein
VQHHHPKRARFAGERLRPRASSSTASRRRRARSRADPRAWLLSAGPAPSSAGCNSGVRAGPSSAPAGGSRRAASGKLGHSAADRASTNRDAERRGECTRSGRARAGTDARSRSKPDARTDARTDTGTSHDIHASTGRRASGQHARPGQQRFSEEPNQQELDQAWQPARGKTARERAAS